MTSYSSWMKTSLSTRPQVAVGGTDQQASVSEPCGSHVSEHELIA